MLDHGFVGNDEDFQMDSMTETQLLALKSEVLIDSNVHTQRVECDDDINSKRSICGCEATVTVEHVKRQVLSTAQARHPRLQISTLEAEEDAREASRMVVVQDILNEENELNETNETKNERGMHVFLSGFRTNACLPRRAERSR